MLGKDKKRTFRTELPIVHIPKVLYHWRCHEGSTAGNPESKQYAYDAGKRALEDFFKEQGLERESGTLTAPWFLPGEFFAGSVYQSFGYGGGRRQTCG